MKTTYRLTLKFFIIWGLLVTFCYMLCVASFIVLFFLTLSSSLKLPKLFCWMLVYNIYMRNKIINRSIWILIEKCCKSTAGHSQLYCELSNKKSVIAVFTMYRHIYTLDWTTLVNNTCIQINVHALIYVCISLNKNIYHYQELDHYIVREIEV